MSTSSQPPVPDPGSPERSASRAGLFYRVNSSRCTFAELWRDVRSPLVLIVWLTKLLGIKLPGSVNDPQVVALSPFEVPADSMEQAIPEDARQALAPVQRELSELGFGEPLYFLMDDVFQHSRTVQVVLRHRDSRTLARITQRVEGVDGAKTHTFSEFLSELNGRRFLQSTNARAQLDQPETCTLNWQPKASTSQLWVSHRRELETVGGVTNCPPGRDAILGLLERHHELVRDNHLERGVFTSMSGADLAHVEALDRSVEQARSGNMRHPDVMAHLERLQKRRVNVSSALVVLFVTIGLFIVIGAPMWELSWQFLLGIVAILLVHEAGHYVAMRLFNYRNVQMFFIPLFGAAVSGQHYTAPGWKRVVVALMGPLPGIYLGAALGIYGLRNDSDVAINAALLTIGLNALQLLPVLPFDGGRVMHALLFSRHHWLDTLFQAIAVTALAGVGVALGSAVFLGLAIIMLIAIPVTYKTGQIAREVRHEMNPTGATLDSGSVPAVNQEPVDPLQPIAVEPLELPAPAPEEIETIPVPVADAIIEKTRARLPLFKAPKQIAEMTLRIYEMVATRPPGIAASLGFGLLHVGSLLGAILALAFLGLAREPGWFMFMDAASTATRTVQPDAVHVWERPEVTVDTAVPDTPEAWTVVASFATDDAAIEPFGRFCGQESGPRAVLFGQTVLLTVSESETATTWFDRLESQSDKLFVAASDQDVSLVLTCGTTSSPQAQALTKELTEFLQLSNMRLIPPWTPVGLDPRTKAEREEHEAVRALFRRLLAVSVFDAPELEALDDKLVRATRRNDTDAYDRIKAERDALWERLVAAEVQRIRDEQTSGSLLEFVDRYEEIRHARDEVWARPAKTVDEIEARARAGQVLQDRFATELWPAMGMWPATADGDRLARRYGHSFGYTLGSGQTRLYLSMYLADVSHGAPAVLHWLERCGWSDFMYEFEQAYVDDDYDY